MSQWQGAQEVENNAAINQCPSGDVTTVDDVIRDNANINEELIHQK